MAPLNHTDTSGPVKSRKSATNAADAALSHSVLKSAAAAWHGQEQPAMNQHQPHDDDRSIPTPPGSMPRFRFERFACVVYSAEIEAPDIDTAEHLLMQGLADFQPGEIHRMEPVHAITEIEADATTEH